MSDWYETRLGDIADICIGGTPSRAEASYWASTGEEGFPWVSISDLKSRIVSNTAESITALGARNSNVKLVPCGTIMMSFKLSLGRIAFAGRDIYTNEAIASFEVDTDKIDKTFLFYQLPEVVKLAITDTAIKGATLNKAKLNELVIPHPKLVVQRKIAEILSTIDNQIDATQALIDKYTAIKQGMMVDLFSRGIDPETKALRPTFEEAPELYHKTPLGMLPKGWDATPLRDVCDLQVGYAFKSSEFVSEGVSLLRGENVGYGKPSWKDRKCLSHSAAENYEEYLLGDSDIVIGMDRTFTKSGVKISKILDTDLPCLLVQRVGRFVPFGVVDGLIEHIVFQNHYLRELMVAEQGMDIPHLSKDDILSPLVAIPECPKEAVLLTAVLDNVTGKLHAEQAFLEKMKLQKNGLMQDLLTGKVPVPA